MGYDYRQHTRDHYKNPDVAAQYHRSFAEAKGWGGLRFRFVAARERATVKALLLQVPRRRRILDIPAGTGKMALVFCELGSYVVSCDISDEMLRIARRTYADLAYDNVAFDVLDLEIAAEHVNEPIDVVVCIRLMHRVPQEKKQTMLEQIARISEYAVVSFALRNRYDDVRRLVRSALFSASDHGLETRANRQDTEKIVGETHQILQRRPVALGLSSEWIYLLKSRRWSPGVQAQAPDQFRVRS